MFESQYKIVQVIKQQKSKKTSIVVNSTGRYFIAKCIPLNNAQPETKIALMRTLRHPNIVSIHDFIKEGAFVYLVEQYCEEGDLAYHMLRRNRKKRRYYMEDTLGNWLLQVLLALEYLHGRGVVHRDLRPENIFLTAQGNVKLGSLKFSKALQKESGLGLAFTLISSPYYSAPQCINKTGYTEKADIWALGCLIQQLCTLKSNNVIENAQRIMNKKNEALPLIYSAQLNQIYMACLDPDPETRPSAKDLLARPYFLAYLKDIVKKEEGSESDGKGKEETEEEKKVTRKIPIKKYNIHKENEQRKKVEEFKLLNLQRKESSDKVSNYLFKKSSLDQNRMKIPSKEEGPYNIKIRAAQEVDKEGRLLQRKSSVETKKDKDKLPEIKVAVTRSKSRQFVKRLSVNKNEGQKQKEKNEAKLKNLPSIDRESESQSSKSANAADINSKQSIQSPNPNKKLPPPRPPRKKSFGLPASDQKQPIINIQQIKMLKNNEPNHLSKSQIREPKKFEQQVKSSVQKIFQNLLTVKGAQNFNEQEELSFQLSDDEDVRLTSAKDEEKEIVDTYKTKLDQLIQWMVCKYSPNMETIMERTMQMDSNTFSKINL